MTLRERPNSSQNDSWLYPRLFLSAAKKLPSISTPEALGADRSGPDAVSIPASLMMEYYHKVIGARAEPDVGEIDKCPATHDTSLPNLHALPPMVGSFWVRNGYTRHYLTNNYFSPSAPIFLLALHPYLGLHS